MPRTGGAVQLVEYLPSMRKNLGLIPSTALEPGIVALAKNSSTLGGESKKIRNSGHPQYAESLRLAWLSWRPYFKKQHKPKKQKTSKNDYSGQCNLNVKGRRLSDRSCLPKCGVSSSVAVFPSCYVDSISQLEVLLPQSFTLSCSAFSTLLPKRAF